MTAIRSSIHYDDQHVKAILKQVVDAVNASGGGTGIDALAALGTNQSGAAQIVTNYTAVTGADGTKGVKLPTATDGTMVIVVNTDASNSLKLYSKLTPDVINALSASTAFVIGKGRTAVALCTADGQWYVSADAQDNFSTTEAALLAGAGTGGTVVASKVQVGDANQNIGAVKATSIALGTSGSETAVTANGTEINRLAGAGTGGTPVASKAQIADANQNIGAVKATSLAIGVSGSEVAQTIVNGVAAGYKVARGVHTQAAASDTVVTGLATVVAVVVTFQSAPTVKQLYCAASIGNQSGAPAAGSVLINTYKPTAVDNCTPTAATDFSENLVLNWVAIGT